MKKSQKTPFLLGVFLQTLKSNAKKVFLRIASKQKPTEVESAYLFLGFTIKCYR